MVRIKGNFQGPPKKNTPSHPYYNSHKNPLIGSKTSSNQPIGSMGRLYVSYMNGWFLWLNVAISIYTVYTWNHMTSILERQPTQNNAQTPIKTRVFWFPGIYQSHGCWTKFPPKSLESLLLASRARQVPSYRRAIHKRCAPSTTPHWNPNKNIQHKDHLWYLGATKDVSFRFSGASIVALLAYFEIKFNLDMWNVWNNRPIEGSIYRYNLEHVKIHPNPSKCRSPGLTNVTFFLPSLQGIHHIHCAPMFPNVSYVFLQTCSHFGPDKLRCSTTESWETQKLIFPSISKNAGC